MTQHEAIKFWIESADKNAKVAEDNLKLKHFDWALFFYQLVLEKLLKGLVVKKTDQAPPPTHRLKNLAKLAGIKLSPKQEDDFDEITGFNLEARYDNLKLEFYKKSHKKDYFDLWINKCREYYQWLKKQ